MEIKQNRKNSNIILACFWTVIAFGLPIWWYTTLVYRAELPHDSINHLYLNKPALNFRIPIKIYSSQTGEKSKVEEICFKNNYVSSNENQYDYNTCVHAEWIKGSTLKNIKSFKDSKELCDGLVAKVQKVEEYSFFVFDPSEVSFNVDEDSVFMSSDRIGIIYHKVSSGSAAKLVDLIIDILRLRGKNESGTSLKILKLALKYQITFDLIIADDRMLTWNIKQSLNGYFSSFLKKLETIADFEVDSQIIHFASLKVSPVQDKDKWFLSLDDLKHFINSAEWNIESSAVSHQNVHFCVFIPSVAYSPLFIKTSSGDTSVNNAFLFPQWGGVHIVNPSIDQAVLTENDLKDSMEIFLSQMRELFGISTTSDNSFQYGKFKAIYEVPKDGFSAIEYDCVLRDRTLGAFTSSIATLNSLSRLILTIQNMQVLDNIAIQVEDSMKLIKSCADNIEKGHLLPGYYDIRQSLELAEKSFFDPKMVSMIYFPDDHKYAVYTPMFFPIVLPVVVSTIRLIKEKRNRLPPVNQ